MNSHMDQNVTIHVRFTRKRTSAISKKKILLLTFKYTILSAFVISTLLIFSCKKKGSQLDPDLEISQLKKYTTSPRVIITNIKGGQSMGVASRVRLKKNLKHELEIIFKMIVDKKLQTLPDHVHPKSGLWVDLKSHRKWEELDQEINNPESYLNLFFLDSQALQIKTGEKNKLTIREVLLVSKTISVEVFVESNNEFELKLRLDDAPQFSYYLNNPIFRIRNNRYYIYRLP